MPYTHIITSDHVTHRLKLLEPSHVFVSLSLIDRLIEIKHDRNKGRSHQTNNINPTHISTDSPVEEIWQTFKTGPKSLVNKHVPNKMTSTRHNQPWVNTNIKRLGKQKQRAYNKAKQIQKWERYRSLKSELQRSCRKAHDQYVNNLITDAGSSAKKKLWTYFKSKRNDKIGVSP